MIYIYTYLYFCMDKYKQNIYMYTIYICIYILYIFIYIYVCIDIACVYMYIYTIYIQTKDIYREIEIWQNRIFPSYFY